MIKEMEKVKNVIIDKLKLKEYNKNDKLNI